MAVFNKFEAFTEELAKGTHQMHAAGHQLELYLTNATPSASLDLIKTDLAEITVENGYTSEDTQNDVSRSGGTTSVTGVDVTFGPATGAGFGPFQYAVLFNQTAASDNLIGWWAYTSSISCAAGESFVVNFGTEMFTLA